MLIKHAHYRNNDINEIKIQFENATEDILTEIENSKDLSSSTRSYIVFGVILCGGFFGIDLFNKVALGEKALQFANSPLAMELKAVYYLMLALFIIYMFYLEKTV
jgi:hypothetical protein